MIETTTTPSGTDFAALGRRLTRGRNLAAVVAAAALYYVAFDVLAADGADLRDRRLAERRDRLEAVLEDASERLALCAGDVVEDAADPVSSPSSEAAPSRGTRPDIADEWMRTDWCR